MAGKAEKEAPLFVGLDCSTQALKASLLSGNLAVLSELEVRFDSDLPHYATSGGTLQGPKGSGIVYSPVKIVVEAIDLLFDRIKAANWPLNDVRGVSAAGQQHASVYWSGQAAALLAQVKPDLPLSAQLDDAFSREEIPNWQDSSTLAECRLLEDRMGGPSRLAQITGSSAHTRFTGPQIMRFKQDQPEAYEKTARISLVSSFMTTLLCLDGEIKGIDESDACGMNLYNISKAQRGWDEEALRAVAGIDGWEELARKLGNVEKDSGRVVGRIGKWYVDRYGFPSECIVCPGTGDNPATFLAFALQEDESLISLGTSDTVLLSTTKYKPDPEYHTFIHPAQALGSSGASTQYFNMLVYKNGSLAREAIRDQYYESSWDQFNRAVESHRPKGSDDVRRHTGFWWLKPEIIPTDASGIHKFSTSSKGHSEEVADFDDASLNAIAILESQMLSYRSRMSAILGDARPKRIFAVGGAASNTTICSVMADIMGCDVCKQVDYDTEEQKWKTAAWNACSVGAAYKAAWSWARHSAEKGADRSISFDAFILQRKETRQRERRAIESNDTEGAEDVAVVASPNPERAKAYDRSIDGWKRLEMTASQACRQTKSRA